MIKYLVIENEYFASMNLIKLVSAARADYKPAFCVESVEDAVELLKTRPEIDLIFMDVELVDGTCFDIIGQVDIDVPVIFTTAYSDFALKAFQLNSVDYLLKPLTREAVVRALDKFEKYRMTADKSCVNTDKPRSRVLISQGDNYFYIPCQDISMIRCEDKYVFLYTFHGKKHITEYANLNEIGDVLCPEQFFRISRGLIVNIRAIVSVRKYFKGRLKVSVSVDGGGPQDVVVSAARREDFLKWLDGYPL